jgi:hypothetical protein
MPEIRRIAVLYEKGDLKTARDVVASVCTSIAVPSIVLGVLSIGLFTLIFSWSQVSEVYKTDVFWATL